MPSLLDLVRGCTFDDFLFTPQYSVLERRDPSADRSVLPPSRALDAEAADRVGQHGHGDASRDGDRRGRRRRHRHHRPRLPQRRHRAAGPRGRDASSAGSTASSRTRTPIDADASLADAAARCGAPASARSSSSTRAAGVAGLLTTRDLRFVERSPRTVAARMTPRDRLVVQRGRHRIWRPPKR